MKVVKRTFEASNHAKGSPERERLNLSAETSEYMTSYRYLISDTPYSFRTKTAADAKLNQLLRDAKQERDAGIIRDPFNNWALRND